VALPLAWMLVACTPGTSEPSPTPTPEASSPSASASSAPEAPAAAVLVADGDAAANLPYFRSLAEDVAASGDAVSGRAYIDALVGGGFDKSAMQVTEDMTTVGNPAESIQFSVRWGEECLIGQVGPATGGLVTVVMPGIPEGGCLIGATRPIDW
jgi:hypothetical protein